MDLANYPYARLCMMALLPLLAFSTSAAQEANGDATAPAATDEEEIEFIVIDATRADEAPQTDEGGTLDYGDEDLDTDYEEPVSEYENDVAELQRYFDLYRESLANQQYDEADSLAKRLVVLAQRLHGRDSRESARALTNLGIVQFKNLDYEAAQLNYESAIEIIERTEDRLNYELINPLKGLGAAQLASGRPDLARQSFDRAMHVSHVNEGPHNLEQVEILDALTETYLSIGEVDDALDMQEHVYNLQTRKIDLDSDDIVPALRRQADWMHRMQFYNRERIAWRKLIRVIEKTRGKGHISLIEPLMGLGKSYLYFDVMESEYQTYSPASSGETYLKRAVRIAEENPEATWNLNTKALLSLGDFYTLSGRPNRAKRTYEQTWAFLSEEDERLRARYEQLEMTNVLQQTRPPKYYNNRLIDDNKPVPESFERGNVVVGFAVSAFGASTNLKIIESHPPGLEDMERAVLRQVRQTIHRPRMEDGMHVPTRDMTYTHEFFYRQSDLDGPGGGETEVAAEQGDQ